MRAFSAEISGRRSPGLGLRCEEGRGSFEQIALLLKPFDLPAHRPQLLALGADQAIVALARVKLSLSDLAAQRLLRDAQRVGDVRDRPARTHHLNRLRPELRPEPRLSSWEESDGAMPSSRPSVGPPCGTPSWYPRRPNHPSLPLPETTKPPRLRGFRSDGASRAAYKPRRGVGRRHLFAGQTCVAVQSSVWKHRYGRVLIGASRWDVRIR